MKPIRILHIGVGNLYGGIETMLVTLARHRFSCEPLKQSFAVCFPGRLKSELLESGVAVRELGAVRVSRPWTVLQARQQLRSVLRDTEFDLVVCHSAWSLGVFGAVARAANRPIVLWQHSGTNGDHWSERWAKRNRPKLAICNSEFTASQIDRFHRDVPRKVLYCPVTVPQPEQSRKVVRAALSAAPATPVILMVARIDPSKGHSVLLDALGSLKQMEWQCWIAGGPQTAVEQQLLHSLERQACELGIAERVRFLGQRQDVPDLLAGADIFCHPHVRSEPFGISIVEAMASGLPVITSDLGGPREIVDKKSGILVKPSASNEVADALELLLGQPIVRQRLSDGARERAKLFCTPEASLQELYQWLVPLVPGAMEAHAAASCS